MAREWTHLRGILRRRKPPAAASKDSDQSRENHASRGSFSERVYLSPASTNIHLVGGDTYSRAHETIQDICGEITRNAEDLYASGRGQAYRRLGRRLRDLVATNRVPQSDQRHVEAHLRQLALLEMANSPQGRIAATADVVALLANVLNLTSGDCDLNHVSLTAAWAACRAGGPIPEHLWILCPRAEFDDDGTQAETVQLKFIRMALEADMAWRQWSRGEQLDADRMSVLWRAAAQFPPLKGYAGHRQAYLRAQLYALDDLASGRVDLLAAVEEQCKELRDALGHLDPLAIDVQIFEQCFHALRGAAWRPSPAWQTTFRDISFEQFFDCQDAGVALRYLLAQAERAIHLPLMTNRRDTFDRLVNRLQDHWLDRFPPADRHLLVSGIAQVGIAYHIRQHNRTVDRRGPGRYMATLLDLVARPLMTDGQLAMVTSNHVAVYADDSIAVSAVRPQIADEQEGGEVASGTLTPRLALEIGRHERLLLSFLDADGDYSIVGEYIGGRISISLAACEFACVHWSDDDDAHGRRVAAWELLCSVEMALGYAMPIDVDFYLSLAENILPWTAPGGGRYAVQFGHLASRDVEFLQQQSGRLVNYWEAALRDLRMTSPETWELVSALVNTAVSHNLHVRHGGQPRNAQVNIVDRALAYLGEAADIARRGGEARDVGIESRLHACTSWMLYLRNILAIGRDVGDVTDWVPGAVTEEVVAAQARAYGCLPSDATKREEVLNSIIDLMVWIDESEHPVAARRYEDVLAGVISSSTAEIGRTVEAVRLLTEHYARGGRIDLQASPIKSLLPKLDRFARLPLALPVLKGIQGLIVEAALAEIRMGRLTSAIDIIEGGTGRMLSNLSATGSGSDAFVASGVVDLVTKRGRPLLYLVAGADDGAILGVLPNGELRAHLVAEMSRLWATKFTAMDAGDAAGEGAQGIRASREAAPQTPSPRAVYDVIDRVGGVLSATLDELDVAEQIRESGVDLVAVADLAALPWQAIFVEYELGSCSTQASAGLLARCQSVRSMRSHRGLAITDPVPSWAPDRQLRRLPEALKEGIALADEYGAEHVFGRSATLERVVGALKAPRRFVHFAVHGMVEIQSWNTSYLVLADPSMDSISESERRARQGEVHLSLTDLVSIGMSTDLALLAACWSAAPKRSLPEEGISFPAAAMRAGARAVVAPLWPIEDRVAREFVSAFYGAWIARGRSISEAFDDAVDRCRANYPSSTTWAAFTLHGDPGT